MNDVTYEQHPASEIELQNRRTGFRNELLAILFFLLIVGGERTFGEGEWPRARLVGDWVDKTEAIEQFQLSLRENGTYRLTIRDLGGPKSDQGQWRLEGDTIVLLMTQSERRDEGAQREIRYQIAALSPKALNVRTNAGRSWRFTRVAQ